jgi:hypothetical protein
VLLFESSHIQHNFFLTDPLEFMSNLKNPQLWISEVALLQVASASPECSIVRSRYAESFWNEPAAKARGKAAQASFAANPIEVFAFVSGFSPSLDEGWRVV